MIFTIGYGNRTIIEFINILKTYGIRYVIDVRSTAYSKHNPDFTGNSLSIYLKDRDIRYLHLGDQLGGRPKDPDCYTEEGRVNYSVCERKAFYQSGIARLEKASLEGYKVVVMCSELRPEDCHRSKLIGRTLQERGIPVKHIDENGDIKTQDEVFSILLRKAGLDKPQQLSLFDEQINDKRSETLLHSSRHSYRLSDEDYQ